MLHIQDSHASMQLVMHFWVKHPIILVLWPADLGTHADSIPTTYVITELDWQATISCPVPDCDMAIEGGWYGIQQHFFFWHKMITVKVME